ncbi:hypothetical protein BDY19DRAFT_268390 [Irpex rosettiformis]|uniref:Uncharacterized protein n=1 Tax=Irpex rosettiformis TaxID=378272 RepID=A0ACB8UHD3_9APHY|nr:hypothetical protein BDY19DRAFT_268390 [Irpex rosettiformis]
MAMSQYDSPYYGGGGGYMASPGGSLIESPGGAMKRSGISQSLRPTTIKQLREATQAHADAEWLVDATNCTYDLDDGTGTIQARHWVDPSQSSDDDEIKEQSYVRVIGNLKSFGNNRFINAIRIRPITDHHEPYYHILDACTVTLIVQRGPPPRPGEELKPRTTGTSAYTAPGSTIVAHDQYAHLPQIQRNIINFILSQPNHSEGVHIAAIARAAGSDAQSISSALDALMDDGHVYTTSDESHYDVSI